MRAPTFLLAAVAAGCVSAPAGVGFPVSLPEQLDAGRPVAIVGDLQQTPLPIRTIMRRESTRRMQVRLLDDLAARAGTIAALVVAGDLVYTGTSPRDWRHFDRILTPIAAEVPVLPAIGNHDYPCRLVRWCRHDVVPEPFLERFPWFTPGHGYVVPYGEAALIFLDSETELEAQGRWLRQQLAVLEARHAWAVVVMHRPPYTDSLMPGVAPPLAMDEQIIAALRATTLVPVVISGHAHGYEHQRIDGIHFIVSAGGGGPRGLLAEQRPHDVYAGRDCEVDRHGRVLRPFNYLLLRRDGNALRIDVRGLCRSDPNVGSIESFEIPR